LLKQYDLIVLSCISKENEKEPCLARYGVSFVLFVVCHYLNGGREFKKWVKTAVRLSVRTSGNQSLVRIYDGVNGSEAGIYPLG
jgi:hypothetical protein